MKFDVLFQSFTKTSNALTKMENLSSLPTNTLVDMLATHTANYLKLTDEIGKEEEYAKTVLSIKALQAEIDARKRTAENTSTTDPNIIIQ
ncbi:hypothetical protein CAP36_14195 [Chitinophagaceae bacterium IBVUCB2]|nr:hypothetical protein CAP36_14195 [Chitinophagaceae bacterium IBVUCB2]